VLEVDVRVAEILIARACCPPNAYDLVPRITIEATAELVNASTVRLGKTALFLSSMPQIVKKFFVKVN
jgi:hypothetical protein